MALTPALSLLGKWLNQRIETKTSHLNETFVESSKLTDDLSNHVVIIGFGKVGEMVARMLTDQKVHYVALDSDIKRVKEMSKRGFSIFHADPTKIESLERVGAHRAKTIIITIREQSSLKKVISVMRKSHPEVPIVVRTEDLRHSHSLRTLGATEIVPEKYEAALQLAGALLRAIGVSEFEVSRVKNQYRAANYERIRDALPPDGM